MDTIDPKEIGRRIQQLRMQKGRSQAELGQHLEPKRSYAAVSDIERGKTNLTVQDLRRIADFLGVPVNRILDEAPAPPGHSYVHYRDAKGMTPDEKRDADKSAADFEKFIDGMDL